MSRRYLYSLDSKSVCRYGGSKARNLRFLLKNHFPVPSGWIISWQAQADFQVQGPAVINKLRDELSSVIDPGQAYAVRSSCTVEDSSQCSCAGLFSSFLNVRGLDSIVRSIQRVWQSMHSPEFTAYKENRPTAAQSARMAVIVQRMVPARCSGVVFSKNPLTGLTETIIEVGRGNGDDQASSGKDPERWVSKWGNWLQKPDKGIISEALAKEIIRLTASIARKYKHPADLEWAYDGQTIYFLQIRPITQLDIPIYSNRIAREMLPGLIKPLVWSVNTKLINVIWVDILTRLTGDHTYRADRLTGHYYYRAYFNMSVFGHVFERLGMPYEALELLFGLELDGPEKPHMRPGSGILPCLPRLLQFTGNFLRSEHHYKKMVRTKESAYNSLIRSMNACDTPARWLELVQSILNETRTVAYFNILIPMQAMMYHRLLTNMLKKHGHDTRSLQLAGVAAATEKYSPHFKIEQLHMKYYETGQILSPEIMDQLSDDVNQFIEQFGHFSDSGNDCSSKPWRETPELIYQMIAQPLKSRTDNDHMPPFHDIKLPWHRRGLILMIYKRTCRFAVHRESISSLYTFGYGQLRTCFMRLGAYLAEKEMIDQDEDIFFLYWHELTALVDHTANASCKDLIRQRRLDYEQYQDVTVPEMIFGTQEPPLIHEQPGKFSGIPTSLGTYTGPAKVLRGLSDFETLDTGDVLIIPFSDVGWTPLFARAGAVVAEAGGILSHSSIVAREYQIPAVVSVSGACRIPNGTIVTVNGYTGELYTESIPAS